jgi:hypothetical protein
LHDVNNQASSASSGELLYIVMFWWLTTIGWHIEMLTAASRLLTQWRICLERRRQLSVQTLRIDWAQSTLRHLQALVSHWHRSVIRPSLLLFGPSVQCFIQSCNPGRAPWTLRRGPTRRPGGALSGNACIKIFSSTFPGGPIASPGGAKPPRANA